MTTTIEIKQTPYVTACVGLLVSKTNKEILLHRPIR